MLDTIRQLSRTVKLKDVIIGSFIPEDSAKGVERRAVWSQEEDCWTVQKLVRHSHKILHIFIKIFNDQCRNCFACIFELFQQKDDYDKYFLYFRIFLGIRYVTYDPFLVRRFGDQRVIMLDKGTND